MIILATRKRFFFAKKNERVKKDGAKNPHKVIDELARAKGNIQSMAIVHIDELMQVAMEHDTSDEHSHQWLDENGWMIKKAYLQTLDGKIYETLLNIAQARDGRKILYALSNTRKIDEGEVLSARKGRSSHANRQFSLHNIPQSDPAVKNQFSFSSPKTDTAQMYIDAATDVHFPNKAAAQEQDSQMNGTASQQQDFTPAPAAAESPMDNKAIADVVNEDGNKRADDIELQYSQRLKGKNAMLFKDLPRVLDYVCDKMPGVRAFWRNRIEKPFLLAKAAFTSRTRSALTEFKNTVDALIGPDDSNVLWTKNNEDIHQLLSDRLQLPAAMAEDVFGNSLTHDVQVVNNDISPKSDTFDTDIPMRHADGSVRTYAEYAGEQKAKKNRHVSLPSLSKTAPAGTKSRRTFPVRFR